MIKKTLIVLIKRIGLTLALVSNTIAQNTPNTPSSIQLNYLQPATYIIENIQVVGTKFLEPEVVLAISSLQVGDTIQIPGPSTSYAIERLWNQKLIKDASISIVQTKANRIDLQIDIVENPRISSWVITGLTESEEKKIVEKLNLSKEKIIAFELIATIKKTIKKYFLEQGYRGTTVDVISIPDTNDSTYTKLKINIHKGEKFIINKIFINGNFNMDSALLKAHLPNIQEKARFTLVKDILYKICTLQPIRRGGIFWNKPTLEKTIVYFKKHFILSSCKFNQKKYEEDKKRLIQYYNTHGYRDAKIIKDTIYKHKEGLLNIALEIEEGKKYYIRNIKWTGNYLHASNKLNSILNINPGSVYNPMLLQERINFNPLGKDISSLYMDEGYLFFHVDVVEVGIEDNKVDIELRIHEGTKATINEINILGNIYTHENIIRRELKTLPGEEFNKTKVIRSQRELAILNIFDPNIEIRPLPNLANNTVNLEYKVKEAPRFDIKGTASLGSGGKLNFGAEIGTNNFSLRNASKLKIPLGDAQSLNIKAEFSGLGHQDISLKFIEPWITVKNPIAIILDITNSFHQPVNSGFLYTFGTKFGIGKKLKWPDDYFILKSGIGYKLYKFKNYDILKDNKKIDGSTYDLNLEISIERNTMNQMIYPTAGSSISLQTKLTPPYSLFLQKNSVQISLQERLSKKEYHQTLLDMQYFYNFWGEFVLNFFGNVGCVGSYTSKQSIGPFERFFMGGTGISEFSVLGKEYVSLRGYVEESIVTTSSKTGFKGGVLFDKLGIELRHPIIKSSMFFIYVLGFAEAGNAWGDYSDFRLLDLKKSVGIGFRLNFPLGLVGIDWGYGLDRSRNNKLELHWSFGGSIR